MPEVTINYLIAGENPDRTLQVTIDNSNSVSELKAQILRENRDVFASEFPSQLTLGKVSISRRDDEELEILRNYYYSIRTRISIENDLGGTELPPDDNISRYFRRNRQDYYIELVVKGRLRSRQIES
ncbi:hypothetical protein C1645_805585 [Glomus cerebriforme]|uniref:Crinkler effector protein N-terminal domain-containing protein n=1 Tax=Glomus cerebriforme TaxID=658196 RepID=A0A397SXJ5_9GLOM|nr:hypothetical protein C1645_805585 [Glomus cerebriforme]